MTLRGTPWSKKLKCCWNRQLISSFEVFSVYPWPPNTDVFCNPQLSQTVPFLGKQKVIVYPSMLISCLYKFLLYRFLKMFTVPCHSVCVIRLLLHVLGIAILGPCVGCPGSIPQCWVWNNVCSSGLITCRKAAIARARAQGLVPPGERSTSQRVSHDHSATFSQPSTSSSLNASSTERSRDEEDNMMQFHRELMETCIDAMARYTFSTCASMPKR